MTEHPPEEIEQRLRGALEARAGSARWEDLRPAAPPTVPGRAFLPGRRSLVVLCGLAAAAACALLALALHDTDGPARPADAPSHSSPAPASPAPGPGGSP